MAGLGVGIAVTDEANRILLQQRADFAVWGLPGGEIESGETAVQAAVREAREETGLDVRLTRLVGLYAMPRWSKTANDHVVVFAAVPVGGDLLKQTAETLDAGFFAIDRLPAALMPWHRQRIQDAVGGKRGVVYLQDIAWPFDEGLTRQDIYRQLDESGLSKHDFLRQFARETPLRDILELDGSDGD
jgi:ADP-ribose pyrophosphatase YjhB (NUDIX family)